MLRTGLLCVGFLSIVAVAFVDAPVPFGTRALAATLWILCLIPSYNYLGQRPALRRPIPFFPVLCLAFGLYYALPLTLGVIDNYYNAPVNSETDYDYPVQLVFLGFVCMVAAYNVIGPLLPRTRLRRDIPWNPAILARWGFLLMFGGLGLSALRSYFASAAASGGTFQFVLSVQWLGTGILLILSRRGELTRAQQITLIIGFAVSAAMLLSNGNIAPVAMFFAVAAFSLWVAKPYFRPSLIIAVVVAGLIAISFRGIVIDFRRTLASAGAPAVRSDNLQLMLTLLQTRIEQQGVAGAVGHGLASTAGRSAILDLFANVARRTPTEVPYWRGQTYLSLVGSVVPRFLWPDKPSKDLGQAFGHRYNLIHASNKSTAINLPILVEFFANFGGTGVIIGMMIVGAIYRVLDALVNRPGQSQLLSMIGVVILLPLLLIESDFSLVIGGLPLTGAAFYVIWRRFRSSLEGRPRRSTGNASAVYPGPHGALPRQTVPPLGPG